MLIFTVNREGYLLLSSLSLVSWSLGEYFNNKCVIIIEGLVNLFILEKERQVIQIRTKILLLQKKKATSLYFSKEFVSESFYFHIYIL